MTTSENPELLARLFPLNQYTDPIQRRQAIGTYGSAVLLMLLALFIFAGSVLVSASNSEVTTAGIFGTAELVGALFAVYSTRRGYQPRGAIVLLAISVIVTGLLTISKAIEPRLYLAGGFALISLGALIVGTDTIPVISLAVALAFTVGTFTNGSIQAVGLTIVVGLPLLVGHAIVNYLLAQGLRNVVRQVAESLNARRLQLAEASSLATQRLLSSRLDLDVLLRESVQLVREAVRDVDEVQLYLVDKERRNAELVATTYKGTDKIVGEKIGVGSLSVIGRATVGGQYLLVRAAQEDQPYRKMAFLPGLVSELAIPLRVGDTTIGALDLQSKKQSAFTPEDIEAIQVLTAQVAVAIDNAQLYAEAQARSEENQRLYDQARTNLREIERLNQQLTGIAWSEYLRGSTSTPAFTIDLTTGQVEDAAEWTPTLIEASRRNQVVLQASGVQKTIAMPISVRGQVIGAMEFEVAPDYDPGPEEMSILQQVIERLGLAAENARLFEEAQRIAQREAMVNEISTRMQAMNNVEAVIAAATQSLADTFNAPRVAIRLGNPE